MTGEFEKPDFDAVVSLDAFLRDCPPDATTLGTFFQYVVASLGVRSKADIDAATEGLPQTRWVAFKQYPLRDFMRLAFNTARIGHSSVSRGEGLRRLGRMAYPSFAGTMAGRVVLFAFGEKLENILDAAPRSYKLALPQSSVVVHKLGERHVHFEMKNLHCFPATYHGGVIEGTIQAYGFEPDVKVRLGASRGDIDFEVRWHPRAR